MAQLIQMRQRIKAIQTIKKITQAMRLISMSTHSRLRHKKVYLENYKKAFHSLWGKLQKSINDTKMIEIANDNPKLIILVGSQKGLCGTFNTALFKYFESEQALFNSNNFYVSVGKHATDFLIQRGISPVAAYNNFTQNHFISIAHALTKLIIQNQENYSSVILYSNYSKSFFLQKPQKTDLFHLLEGKSETIHDQGNNDYIFEQTTQELTEFMQQSTLTVTIQELLFDSLLAEQAARFLSMDASTRNAENLLNEMKLQYNKIRQAAITRELTELASVY